MVFYLPLNFLLANYVGWRLIWKKLNIIFVHKLLACRRRHKSLRFFLLLFLRCFLLYFVKLLLFVNLLSCFIFIFLNLSSDKEESYDSDSNPNTYLFMTLIKSFNFSSTFLNSLIVNNGMVQLLSIRLCIIPSFVALF